MMAGKPVYPMDGAQPNRARGNGPRQGRTNDDINDDIYESAPPARANKGSAGRPASSRERPRPREDVVLDVVPVPERRDREGNTRRQ